MTTQYVGRPLAVSQPREGRSYWSRLGGSSAGRLVPLRVPLRLHSHSVNRGLL